MDQHIIYIEEGNKCNHNEIPYFSNQLMCLAAVVVLTFMGLIQYSVILIVDE